MSADQQGVLKVREHGAEAWDDRLAPGGWVCAVCKTPTESEPCEEHYPQIGDKRTHQWQQFGKPEGGTLCGKAAFHHVFPEFRVVNIDADPRRVTCLDCIYLMQKIEGGPIHAHA